MITLAVDPATHGCGLALFEKNVLVAAGYAPSKYSGKDKMKKVLGSAVAVTNWLHDHNVKLHDVGHLVVELPQVYSRGANKTKGDPNSCVVPLAMVDAALATLMSQAEVQTFQPFMWKGNLKKPEKTSDPEYIFISRVKSRLSEREQAAVDWTNSVERSWDVTDAIGVGLKALGRFERVRVFARE